MFPFLLLPDGKRKNSSGKGNRRYFFLSAIFMLAFFPSAWSQSALPLEQFLASEHAQQPQETGLLEVEKLISEVNPTIYAENGSVNIYGTQPVCLRASASQIAGIPDLGLPVGSVALLTIKISNVSELSTPIDLSGFGEFAALKYVHLLSEIDAPTSGLASLIINAPANVSVFYSTQRTN